MRDECTRYGNVASLEIPRPLGNLPVPGVGKVRGVLDVILNIIIVIIADICRVCYQG